LKTRGRRSGAPRFLATLSGRLRPGHHGDRLGHCAVEDLEALLDRIPGDGKRRRDLDCGAGEADGREEKQTLSEAAVDDLVGEVAVGLLEAGFYHVKPADEPLAVVCADDLGVLTFKLLEAVLENPALNRRETLLDLLKNKR